MQVSDEYKDTVCYMKYQLGHSASTSVRNICYAKTPFGFKAWRESSVLGIATGKYHCECF